jgi:hypothetical protein
MKGINNRFIFAVCELAGDILNPVEADFQTSG